MSMFQKATKTKSKLRLALFGPSGAGKTYTALSLAQGIGGPIAVIDTEYGSAAKYADRFEFDAANANDPSIDEIIDVINEARDYNVLIVDSLTHPWQELLAEIDQLAKTKYKGNTWSAWSDGTPKQKRLIRTILGFPGHFIATMRSKTEWTTTEGKNGSKTPQRVGLAPEQGKGIEYEFDMLMEISSEHVVQVIKDRTGKFQDKLIDKPGAKFGGEIASWLNEGAEPEPTRDELLQEMVAIMSDWTEEQKAPFREQARTIKKNDLPGLKSLLAAVRKANNARIRELMSAQEDEDVPEPDSESESEPEPEEYEEDREFVNELF
ncbi:MAG: ATP-binding protein [Alkalispirochaeta sp.]